ncbi:MAG: 16S rRNA (cytidine(1402)-2'-O)-methyltransferase, partial [Armatimonadota bacterium]
EHNERARTPQILEALRGGKSVALVSDAGTPSISDPGAALVADAIREGLPVVTVPGPSAVTAAISLADFPTDRFAFVGFAPRRSAERRRFLESLAGLPMALVMFEAPHRIRQALADIEDIFGARRILLVRELTKVHEEMLRGTAAEVRETLDQPRGEFTLVIEPAPARAGGGGHPGPAAAIPPGAPLADPEDFVRGLLAQGLSRRDAAKALAAAYGLPSKDAYRIAIGED